MRRIPSIKTASRFRHAVLWAFTTAFIPGLHAGETPPTVALVADICPTKAAAGERVEFTLTICLPSGWVVFDVDQGPDTARRAEINLNPPSELVPRERFVGVSVKQRPEPFFNHRPTRFLDSDARFRRPLVVSADARPGALAVEGHASFLLYHRDSGRWTLAAKQHFAARMEVVPFEKPLATTNRPAPQSNTLSGDASKPAAPSATAPAPTPVPSATAPLTPAVEIQLPQEPVADPPILAKPTPSAHEAGLRPWLLVWLIPVVLGAAAIVLRWLRRRVVGFYPPPPLGSRDCTPPLYTSRAA